MTLAATVTTYSGIIVLGALAGGVVPLYVQAQTRLITFLAFAAGVMFGAAFFHMLPEAFHEGGYAAFVWLPVGFVALFVLERYVLAHICEEPPECEEHQHGTAAFGLTAFFGMSAHTLFDGVALGSACTEGVGLMALIAITAHKIPSSLSLASILKSGGRGARRILAYVALFGMMVPLGVALYFALSAVLKLETLAAKALAFSAGTFLYIAVSDLLPHVNRHGHGKRLQHILGLVGGLALMFALSSLSHEGAH